MKLLTFVVCKTHVYLVGRQGPKSVFFFGPKIKLWQSKIVGYFDLFHSIFKFYYFKFYSFIYPNKLDVFFFVFHIVVKIVHSKKTKQNQTNKLTNLVSNLLLTSSHWFRSPVLRFESAFSSNNFLK